MTGKLFVVFCSDARADKIAPFIPETCEVFRRYKKKVSGTRKDEWETWSQRDRKWVSIAEPERHVDVAVVHWGAPDEGLFSAWAKQKHPKHLICFASYGLDPTIDVNYKNATLIQQGFPLDGEIPEVMRESLSIVGLDHASSELDSESVPGGAFDRRQNPESLLERARASAIEVFRACGETPPLELPSATRLRTRLWHGLKNLIDAVVKSVGEGKIRQRLDDALQGMKSWETVVRGEAGSRLLDVAEEVEKEDFKAAFEKAWEAWLEAGAGHSGRPGVTGAISEPPHFGGSWPRRFRILVVEDNETQLTLIHQRLLHMARQRPDYEIDVIRCDSSRPYDSALAMVDLNEGIQGAVVDWDLSGSSDVYKGTNGLELIKEFKSRVPGICCVLLTGRSIFELPDESVGEFRAVSKDDPAWLDLCFRIILSDVKKRSETPFFSALKGYSERPISVLHALGISGARVVGQSDWLREFADFYGENVFRGESSATGAPLDSLLSPRRSLLDAECRVAQVYGADRCRLVTNGTSTANKIVHQALLKPGDKVLIDRTCHKSHHYALVLVGATPVYLNAKPFQVSAVARGEFLGFCTAPSIETILEQLDKNPKARMLCLTNCTFDGFVHDSRLVVEQVWQKLDELRNRLGATNVTDPKDFIFFFDEAWFGFARFSRALRRYTGMYAAESYVGAKRRPRVYVTQSVHKTMVAFRQGSIVLISDPQYPKSSHAFEEAFFTHTSTSPSYQILASLDAGRMWADMEGAGTCVELHRIARELRRCLSADQIVNTVFSVLSPEQMLQQHEGEATPPQLAFDETKVTLFIKTPSVTGGEVNRRLLQHYDIQFNKYTNNSVLFVLTPGVTETVAGHVHGALRRLASEIIDDSGSEDRKRLQPDLFNSPVQFCDRLDLRAAYFGILPEGEEWEEGDIPLTSAESKGLPTLNEATYVSQRFVIPYPPGFPILVPGEIVTRNHVVFLANLDIKEVHGLDRRKMRVWRVPSEAPPPGGTGQV